MMYFLSVRTKRPDSSTARNSPVLLFAFCSLTGVRGGQRFRRVDDPDIDIEDFRRNSNFQ